MKRFFNPPLFVAKTLKIKLIFFACLFLSSPLLSQAQTHRMATFNIRWDNPSDTGNLWQDRQPEVTKLIQRHSLGLIGVQEALDHQLNQLTEALGYDHIGVGRDDGAKGGEFSAILFDANKYELLDEGTFWLSPTPDTPSKGWDAALNRICTWGKFRGNLGEEFFVFNIHYDHMGERARIESSKVVLAQSKEINSENLPAIWMGDFNVTPEDEAYQIILDSNRWKDARLISQKPSTGPRGTFTGFKWEADADRIIDHVFVSSGVRVLQHAILDDSYGEKYPSDHFPVMVEVEFKVKLGGF
ncbi:endonuclease/exonuclease/phosphatase family protein [Algoriphagus namhaensis]